MIATPVHTGFVNSHCHVVAMSIGFFANLIQQAPNSKEGLFKEAHISNIQYVVKQFNSYLGKYAPSHSCHSKKSQTWLLDTSSTFSLMAHAILFALLPLQYRQP